jgi:hypothetical protein
MFGISSGVNCMIFFPAIILVSPVALLELERVKTTVSPLSIIIFFMDLSVFLLLGKYYFH